MVELNSRVSELTQKNSIEISVDELTDHFYNDFTALENMEVLEKAEVPSRWKSEMADSLRKELAEGIAFWREHVVKPAEQWDPTWQINYDLIWEERHRRKIPVPDATIERRIIDHKKYRGQ